MSEKCPSGAKNILPGADSSSPKFDYLSFVIRFRWKSYQARTVLGFFWAPNPVYLTRCSRETHNLYIYYYYYYFLFFSIASGLWDSMKSYVGFFRHFGLQVPPQTALAVHCWRRFCDQALLPLMMNLLGGVGRKNSLRLWHGLSMRQPVPFWVIRRSTGDDPFFEVISVGAASCRSPGCHLARGYGNP